MRLPHTPSSASNNLSASLALPDADAGALHAVLTLRAARNSKNLPAKDACVLGTLRNLDLLSDLTQASTITGAVLANNSDFLGVAGHFF